jgi:membrane protein YqaA with SNARE-associated domain
MLRRLYDWVLSLAARPRAEMWLAIIAFVEACCFLVPADILFLPMALAKPSRAFRYALVATIAATLGSLGGYAIGHYAFELVAKPMLELYGKLEAFNAMKSCVDDRSLLLLLGSAGLTHLPPIKLITIMSGAVNVGLLGFVLTSAAAQGARFFLLALALRRYGEPIRLFIEKRLGIITGLFAAIVIGVYLAIHFLSRSGSMAC